MPDGAFAGAVAETADCGILLDLHNIFTNAMNGRQTVEDFMKQIPLNRVWEIHLAGGFEMEDFWLDAHSGAIPDHLLQIAKSIVPALPNLKAIIFEVFAPYVPIMGLDLVRAEIEKIHELWNRRGQLVPNIASSEQFHTKTPVEIYSPLSPYQWEKTLGALVIGQTLDNGATDELAADPGIKLVHRLIREFRGSMIVNVLRLTARLMMLTLGKDIFLSILEDFWSKYPPQQFASSEAEAFARYLQALDFKVPHLAKILEFEQAVLATLLDQQSRVISFDFDPLPLFRALAEGRLPEMIGQPGNFEIEVTDNGPISATGLDLDAVRQIFPFH
jgi:hypothetical protein